VLDVIDQIEHLLSREFEQDGLVNLRHSATCK
jgi:hypothetical protein